jgi:hypothetical protein
MHGLNTSLGNGFENIAHILSGGFKRKFTKGASLNISAKQAAHIGQLITGLKAGSRTPNILEENKLIMDGLSASDPLERALEFTADVYLDSEKWIKCIEMKSVRPNSGESRGEKEKILHAKAAFKRLNPTKEIKFYVGFPFDPTSKTVTGYDKERFMDYLIEFKKFFSPDEILIASELWDHLSGQENTMEEILQITAETVEQFCAVTGSCRS